MTDKLTICGLFEMDLVNKGIMQIGRCRDCFNNDSFPVKDQIIWKCEKKGRLDQEQTDCSDWIIDTR